LGGLGDGIATFNGKPLFIPKSTQGDVLDIRIVHETKEALRGEIAAIVTAGPQRVQAPCPHFSLCGGCSHQHIAQQHYRDFKQGILHTALGYAGFRDYPADITFLPAATRRRAEFKILFDGNRLALAYHGLRSHDRIAIQSCIILTPALQNLLPPLAQVLGKLPFARELESVSITQADSGIDLLLELKKPMVVEENSLSALAETLNIGRISLQTGSGIKTLLERHPIAIDCGGYAIAIPPHAFLQASKEAQILLTEKILAATAGVKSIVDLFCGIGTYSFPLAKSAQVLALEGDATMASGLRAATHAHGITTLTAKQRDLFKSPLTAKELSPFTAAIINPPRAGAKAQTEALAQSKIQKVVMVSCNPATFSRDAKTLKEASFSLESAQGIDQFAYSPHLEIVAVFSR
jgi:23S rRNA (uracil1939-C5)-methyltransferase